MSEWKTEKLSKIAEIKYGKDHKKLNDGTIPVYGSGGIMRYADTFIYDKESVLIPRKGTLNNVFYVSEPFWTVDTIFWTKINEEVVIPKYFFYYINQLNLELLNVGTAVPSLTTKILNELEIPLPPLPTQRRIAAILSSLDDKIENNRKTAEKLEEIAQAIFKRWFVEFEFPNDNGKPYKSSGGEMVYCDELGKDVPKGWEVGTIKDCCEKIQNGGTPRRDKEDYWCSNDIPWLTSGEVRENVICKVNNYISNTGFENSSAKWLPLYATVVALYGATAGQVALLAISTTTNQAICGLIAKKNYTFFNYILLSLSSNELFNKAIGSAQQNISKKIVEEYKTILPTELMLLLFDKIISQIYYSQISKINENIKLQQIRDTLLPKLMSGELVVKKEVQ